jgi:hypothetical protein
MGSLPFAHTLLALSLARGAGEGEENMQQFVKWDKTYKDECFFFKILIGV